MAARMSLLTDATRQLKRGGWVDGYRPSLPPSRARAANRNPHPSVWRIRLGDGVPADEQIQLGAL
jgi:hypothetical protein